MAFNDSTNREDRLGVWDTLVRHLTALGRLLRLAPGHALLAGPPGAGRLTLVQLAAFIHDAKLHCLSLVPTYALPEWRGDLKRVHPFLAPRGRQGTHRCAPVYSSAHWCTMLTLPFAHKLTRSRADDKQNCLSENSGPHFFHNRIKNFIWR